MCMIFQEKYFSCYILLADQMVCSSLLLEILDNMCIVIIWCPVSNVINFENNNSFHIKPFLYTTKKSGQKCKYLKNEKSFNMK